jgi:hypothetical protein
MDYKAMACWVLACGLPPAVGATWLAREWSGPAGSAAAGGGAGIALAVLLVSGAAIGRAGRRSATRAAFLFAGSAVVRIILSAALAAGAWAIFSLPVTPLLLSLLVSYLAGSLGECAWLMLALRGWRAGMASARGGPTCS